MRKASAPIILLIVLVIIALSFAGGGFYLLQKEKIKNLELGQKLEELNTKQKITETKLKESQGLISGLQVKLQEAKSQIETISTELRQEKTSRLEALGRIGQLESDLEEQKRSRSDLENKLQLAQDGVRKTITRLKELEQQRLDLESKVKELEEKSKEIELGKIIVSPETGTPGIQSQITEQITEPAPAGVIESAGLEGKVLVVNKDYNFIVINLGRKDGINIGQTFSIYHNNKYIGDANIEKVHDSMAAAGFASGDIKDKVSEGDKVMQKVK